jgi:adenylyltransferase/sulfurtransferase
MPSTIHIPAAGQEEGRFARFELISWWDQERLSRAKVMVVGAGALGNEILKNLALIGVGRVLVVDMDRIENSNLSRSVLYRAEDCGRPKAEVACRAATALYPDMRAEPFVGNSVYDLGWGAYVWADVILGGLDNREARVAINSSSLFAGKPWIDGAIEVLSGVASVFAPGQGACYECTMSERDWKILETRRSCALLSRSELQEGKVPTTPTTASLIAGFQVQEAVKILHGLEALAGKGFVFNGLTGEAYTIQYTRKPDCGAHETYGRLVRLKSGVADIRVGELLALARKDLKGEAVIELRQDVIAALTCMNCGRQEQVFHSLGAVTEADGKCPHCGEMRTPELLHTLGLDGELDRRTFAEIGLPPFDGVTARSGENTVTYLFEGDAPRVLRTLGED